LLDRAPDHNYISRFRVFGLDPVSDITALKESRTIKKPEISPKDPFNSYGRPRLFKSKYQGIKPTHLHVKELKLD
jgi:hypothetical protein